MFSIDFYRKLNFTFGLLVLGILFGIITFAATLEVKDLDLWFHLRSGNYIVHHREVPVVDVFSCSAKGQTWNNHEWLFQVIVYGVKRLWGMDALIYMQAGVVLLTFLVLMLLTYRASRLLLMAPLLYLVFLVYQTRFTIRPDIFSILLMVTFIAILATSLKRRWSLWALFFLQIIWTNMHGYFFLGVLIVVLALAAEWIKRRVHLPWSWNKEGLLTDEEFRRLHLIGGAVILATLINPMGWRGTVYPLTVLWQIPSGASNVFFEHITELRRPLSLSTLWDMGVQWPYKALIFLSAVALFLGRRRLDIRVLLFWLFFLLFSVIALRNITYFAVMAYLLLMISSVNISVDDLSPVRFLSEKFMHLTGVFVGVLLMIGLLNAGCDLQDRGYYDFDAYARKSVYLGIDRRVFPHHAVDFLRKNNIKGNFFNDFNSGAFLIGRVYPNIRVFMDGRTELRGAKFFTTYKKLWEEGDEKLFDEMVARYQLTGAFVNTAYNQAPEKFLKMISNKKDWYMVYLDYDAAIFLKDAPVNEEAIDKNALDMSMWKPYGLDLKKFGPMPVVPYPFVSRANSLLAMGFDDLAMAEADAALVVYPSFSEAHAIKGRIYYERKEFEKAFKSYRTAASLDTGDMDIRSKLVVCYYETGAYDEAIKQAEEVLDIQPSNVRAQLAMARSFAKKKQNKKAYDILVQAFKSRFKKVDDVVALGDIFFTDKAYVLAGKCYKMVLQKDPLFTDARVRLGDVLKEQKNISGARLQWRRAMKSRSDDKGIKERLAGTESKPLGK